jgi:undecaprenyl-diphosphatase
VVQFLFLLAILIVIWKKRWNTILVLIGCIMAVGLADLTAARVLKPYFQRPRPQATEPHIRLLVPSQGSYSFPSNHAANMFAAATFFSFTVPIVGLIGTLAAFLVAYSRVYVGVHYPLDVLAGAVLGIFWAVVIFKAYV